MKNSEKMLVTPVGKGIFRNFIQGFKGTAEEAKKFAKEHNYNSGVEVIDKSSGKVKYISIDEYKEEGSSK